MNPFSKMRLLPEEEFQRLREARIKGYDPKLRTMAFLQTEVDRMLDDSSPLLPSERLQIFTMAQSRFENLQRQQPNLPGGPLAQPAPPIPVHVETLPVAELPAEVYAHHVVPEAQSPPLSVETEPLSRAPHNAFHEFAKALPNLVPEERLEKASAFLNELRKVKDLSVDEYLVLRYRGDEIFPLPELFHKFYRIAGLTPKELDELTPAINFIREQNINTSMISKLTIQKSVRDPEFLEESTKFVHSTPGVKTRTQRATGLRKRYRVLHVY